MRLPIDTSLLFQKLAILENNPSPHVRVTRLATIPYQHHTYPLYAVAMGKQTNDVPCLTFVAGIHGVERIGSEVVLAFLETLIQRLVWDESLIAELQDLKLLFIPIANPVGSVRNMRSNGNHVDLMRNAPVDAEVSPPFLIGGHRLHRHIPWYRGKLGAPMETEAEILCNFIREQAFPCPFSIVLDCHSGFGFEDRLWFPYAYTKQPIQHLSDVYSIKRLLNQTYPHLNYVFEPQSLQYTTHGDLWDFLYRESLNKNTTFLPLTMEMGSWRWIKKNPLQMRSISGLFNPTIPHRLKRVLRQHIVLMEFLIRATRSYAHWLPKDQERVLLHQQAIQHWYEQ